MNQCFWRHGMYYLKNPVLLVSCFGECDYQKYTDFIILSSTKNPKKIYWSFNLQYLRSHSVTFFGDRVFTKASKLKCCH